MAYLAAPANAAGQLVGVYSATEGAYLGGVAGTQVVVPPGDTWDGQNLEYLVPAGALIQQSMQVQNATFYNPYNTVQSPISVSDPTNGPYKMTFDESAMSCFIIDQVVFGPGISKPDTGTVYVTNIDLTTNTITLDPTGGATIDGLETGTAYQFQWAAKYTGEEPQVQPVFRVRPTSASVVLSDITINNITCTGTGDGNYHNKLVGCCGFLIESADRVTMNNCVANYTTGDGMTVGLVNPGGYPPTTRFHANNTLINVAGRQGITIASIYSGVFNVFNVNPGAEGDIDFESDIPEVGSANVTINDYTGLVGVQMISPLYGPVTFNNMKLGNDQYGCSFTVQYQSALSGQPVYINNSSIVERRVESGTPPAPIWTSCPPGYTGPAPTWPTLVLNDVTMTRNTLTSTGEISTSPITAPSWLATNFTQILVYDSTWEDPKGTYDDTSSAIVSSNPPPAATPITPTITSANNVTFTEYIEDTFSVITTGDPAPTVSQTGTLPTGITFNENTLSGAAQETGTFPLVFTASNTQGSSTQDFNLTVIAGSTAPVFLSSNETVFTEFSGNSFTVEVSDDSPVSLSGTLPSGVSFDGTNISGTPNVNGSFEFVLTASGPNGTTVQDFSLTVVTPADPPPPPPPLNTPPPITRFDNTTTDGNETAFKRGNIVPPGAVNLAWIESPTLSPGTNMVVIDTTNVTTDNIETAQSSIYFANLIGKLEDDKGNKLITEQYPAIASEFSIEGDLTGLIAAGNLDTDYIFSYAHVSRYFHLDKAGLSPGTSLTNYSTASIKVVDASGNIYADSSGNPLFRIKIISLYQPWPGITHSSIANPSEAVAAYRVYAFVDNDTTEDLYLTYDKIDVDINGNLINQVINYQEILNPQPYYQYRPEESEVADLFNSDQTWYSSKSVALKNQLLGLPATNTDGYEIVVPQKAIPDPRLFQLFRWRVVCSFSDVYNVDSAVDHPINCGVVVTNNMPTSTFAQVFNLISEQPINIPQAVFANPLNATQSSVAKSTDEYWYVNMDTITPEELSDFDFLIWSPDTPNFDFTSYMTKIHYFTKYLDKVLLIDTDSYMVPEGLGVTTTAGTTPGTGFSSTIPVESNNSTPDNRGALANLETWVPPLYLGMFENVTNYNPPPPPGSSWHNSTDSAPPTTGYLSYQATDGNIYWIHEIRINGILKVVSYEANSLIPSTTSRVDDKTYEGIEASEWLPPLLLGMRDANPNPPPPGGTDWSQTVLSNNYLSYKATDNNTYYASLPLGLSYATVNPAITLTGDIETIVQEFQSWFPTSYPNISPNGGRIGTNVNPLVKEETPTQVYTTLSGALYNFPPAKSEAPSTAYSTKPTNLSYYLPVKERNPIEDTDNGATYYDSSNIFDASILNGWTIDTSEPISSLQTRYGVEGAKVQYLLDLPGGYDILVSGQIANLTTTPSTETIGINEYIDTKGITSATTTVEYGKMVSGFTVGEIGTIAIEFPTLPAGAVLSEMIIATSTPYTNASTPNPANSKEVGLGVIISNSTNTTGTNTGINFQAFSVGPGGTLNKTCVIPNGASIDTSQQFNLTYTDANAILGRVVITTTFSYYTTSESSSNADSTTGGYLVPFLTPVPLMVESGPLLISTLGLPQSAALGVVGSQQLLLNIALYATANRALETYSDQTYASSFTFATPWKNSWVINVTDYPTVLTEAEITKNNFFYLPEDAATPINVWQRQLSTATCEELINAAVSPSLLKDVAGTTGTYSIEVSNSLVETPSNIYPYTVPYAWTRAYTPIFSVPPNVETYMIRETEVRGDYAVGTYINRSYPNEPYLCQIRSYMDSDNVGSLNVDWTAAGTATLTYDTTHYTPPSTKTETVPVTQSVEVLLNAADHGLVTPNPTYVENHLPYTGVSVPAAIQTYQDDNYYSTGTSACWPFMGLIGAFGLGSSGEEVEFIQYALNYFNGLGYFNFQQNGALAVPIDGNFGPATQQAVLDFQQQYHAIYQNGIVDAETFAIIGTQVLRSGLNVSSILSESFMGLFNYPWNTIQYENISDGNTGSQWRKRSFAEFSPNYIWDLIAISLDQVYSVHGVTITPWVEGITDSIRIDGVNAGIQRTATAFGGYDPASMMLPNLGLRGQDNVPVYIPFNPVQADQVFVNIGQDGPAYPGYTTRVFGVRDISINATIKTTSLVSKTVVVPGYKTTNKVSIKIPIYSNGTATVSFAKDYTAYISPQFSGEGTISDIVWTGININQPSLHATITPKGLLSIGIAGANGAIDVKGNISFGPLLPTNSMSEAYPASFQPPDYRLAFEGPVLWMTPEGKVSKMPEVGMISKADGLKLLCDFRGNPVGFPPMPTNAAEEQVHYVNLSINSYGTTRGIEISFYDITQQEFVTNANGLPEIAYADYISRGPNNIYVGVLSTFEVDTKTLLPGSDDSPPIPNSMVMPAYGVETLYGSAISLTTLPANLGRDDIWPIPVITGSFSQPIQIRPTSSGAITGYLSKYQGTDITAFYSVPEAASGPWSSIFGPPNVDISMETPLIAGASSIQVCQPPMLMSRQPTIYDTLADPVRPIFTVYMRDSLDSAFQPLAWSEIDDYEVSSGTIYLSNALASTDPNLLAVSYTSTQNVYLFKEYNGQIINLNPYSSQNDMFSNKPIYVYVLPDHIVDANGNVVSESQQTRTLRYAFDGSIFDPLDPAYDPTAVQLGIIYITTDFDLNDLVLLDSRRRGGGAQDGVSDSALISQVSAAKSYIDVSYGTGMSYQNGCYIIVQLPNELKYNFTEQDIKTIIRRNLSAGVQFDIQDTEGNNW